MRLILSALAASSLLLLSGCGKTAPGYPGPAPLPPDQIMSFTTLFHENCAACHGVSGQDGPAMDLNNPEYQAIVSSATLRQIISNGMPGTEMPAFAQSAGGMLTARQVDAIVSGIRKRWFSAATLAGANPPPYAQSKPGNVQQGQQVYQQRCAICHQSGSQDITDPAYLALMSDQAIRVEIIAGRPDIGQPDWRHDSPGGKATTPLTNQQVDDLVTYLSSLRKPAIPTGSAVNANPGEVK
jgi:cytochrome c oxidase cbb3-type subunit 3/ubiquinol-cytochrome c reductase cytochrome c subunit